MITKMIMFYNYKNEVIVQSFLPMFSLIVGSTINLASMKHETSQKIKTHSYSTTLNEIPYYKFLIEKIYNKDKVWAIQNLQNKDDIIKLIAMFIINNHNPTTLKL